MTSRTPFASAAAATGGLPASFAARTTVKEVIWRDPGDMASLNLAEFKVMGVPTLRRGGNFVAADGTVYRARLERKLTRTMRKRIAELSGP